jgi:hypothetical protein
MSLNSIQIQRKRGTIDTPITKIHVCSLFWLGTGRLVKGGVVKLVIWQSIMSYNLYKHAIRTSFLILYLSRIDTGSPNKDEQRRWFCWWCLKIDSKLLSYDSYFSSLCGRHLYDHNTCACMQYRIATTTCLIFFHFLSRRRICRYQMSKQKSWVNGQIPKE